MRSKAHFRSHPIHPALVPFPLAFLLGSLGFDVVGVLSGNPELWRVGGTLAICGVVAGVVAAVPGVIDYLFVVPPRSTGKRRATKHMGVNSSAIALFFVAFVLRGGVAEKPTLALLVMETLGAGLLMAGGWMGGTLVSRNQISVDHRYAGAGKWREAKIPAEKGESVLVAGVDELQINQMKLLRTPHGRIVLARTEAAWIAFDDHCTHRGGSLADGVMICGIVQCPWHGSQFDATSGAVRAGPAKEPIRTYPVEQRADGIYLKGR